MSIINEPVSITCYHVYRGKHRPLSTCFSSIKDANNWAKKFYGHEMFSVVTENEATCPGAELKKRFPWINTKYIPKEK